MSPHPLPTPPWDMQPFDTGNLVMFALNGVILLMGSVWALRHAHRHRRLIPVCLLPAGALASLHEPLVDVIAHCLVPVSPTWSAFSLYGRPITFWHPLAYAVFYGLMPAALFIRLRSGMAPESIWWIMLLVLAFDLILEGVMVDLGTWRFYGPQPLVIAGMPLWWGAMNCIGIVTTAAVMYFIEPWLRGARVLLLLLWIPTQHAAEIALVGWPSWLVINSEVAAPVRQAGGVLTYGIAISVCAIVIRLLKSERRASRTVL
jgi:hypothetical protein